MAILFSNLVTKRIFNKLQQHTSSYFRTYEVINSITLNIIYKNFHTSQSIYKKRKSAEEKKLPKMIAPKSKVEVIDIWKNMTVEDLAAAMKKNTDHVFEVMLYVDNSDQYSDNKSKISRLQVIQDIVKKSGLKSKIVPPPDIDSNSKSADRDAIPQPPASAEFLKSRPAVVTVMGHVDHGKTTLLDSLRHTSVVKSEFGGITQHIGAFLVTLQNEAKITFLDTPGHAAFKAMRERGANVTDLVVLVVAADDGVMEQTVESIRMAKEAGVPIIVAINKIDKPEADIDRTVQMLSQFGVQTESLGGDIQAVPVSALKGTGLSNLTDAIVAQAELLELCASSTGLIEGAVIESRIDQHRGKLATILIQRGTLFKGAVLVAGTAWAKVRSMFDHKGDTVSEAPPSTAVEVLGWRELPTAGTQVLEVDSERRAHEVVRWREAQEQEQRREEDVSIIRQRQQEHQTAYRTQLEYKRRLGRAKLKRIGPREKEIKIDSFPAVRVVIKGDVDGTVEAILDVLDTYDSNSNCKLDVVHYGVGNISETDIDLASAFDAIIYGFNIDCPTKIMNIAETESIKIKMHNVIYKLVDDLKQEISSKLPEKETEVVLGEANVLQQFIINDGRRKVPVAGCRCVKGVLKKNSMYRLIRGQEVLHEGKLESMRHMKNEVDTIKKDVECGLQFVDKTIEFQLGDKLVCYEIAMVSQETQWDPGF